MKFFLLVVLLSAFVAFTYAVPIDGQVYALKDQVELAKRYARLIEKEGVKAWHFLECMGNDWAMNCVGPTLGCMAAENLVGCIELIVCEGLSARTCAPSFK